MRRMPPRSPESGQTAASAPSTAESRINIWYGALQRFGHQGRPQRWLNVLGNVARPESLAAVTFSINGSQERPLALGSDLHRLAGAGDFNLEIAWAEVDEGDNSLTITAVPRNGPSVAASVRLLVEQGNTWPLPCRIDFARVERLQDAVQIVDGLWRLEADGVRTAEPYYDRVLTMGDASWTDYEATVRLTLHGFTPSGPGPPTYDVTHFGVAMRWGGHHADGLQPSRRWFPLGAQGELLLKEDLDRCRWRILFDGTRDKPPQYAEGSNRLVLGAPAYIKTQVVAMPDGCSRYRFKQWMEDEPEPADWDVEGFEEDDEASGSLCVVPHNSDVTIHAIDVESAC